MRRHFLMPAGFLGLSWALSALSVASAAPGYFRQPAIEGDTLVFVAEGDLWRVPVAGGAAQRLTTNLAEESQPRISPDGKLIAFTARYEGPAEVYVMPLAGGLPTRLTHEGDNARVQGFTPDGKVLYASARWSGKPMQRLYAIDPATRAVTPVPLAEAAEGCYRGSELVFTRNPQISDNVKNYRGGQAQRLWRFDGKSEATLISGDFAGTSRQPMCGGGRIAFLSDRDGTMNVWSQTGGAAPTALTRHKGFDVRSASMDAAGKRIAYQRGADIHVVDVASGADRVVPITLVSDFEHTRVKWVKNPWDFVTAIEPSPNGDRVVATVRGEVVVLPVGNGRRVSLVNAAEVRARDAQFSSNGKNVFAFADGTGEFELTRYAANGVGPSAALTKGATTMRRAMWPSPDGKWVAHDDFTRNLYLTDVATGATRTLDRSAYEAHIAVTWSPDSRHLVIAKNARNQFDQLWLIEVASGKATLLTSDRYDASSAAFAPDGKWLYFLASRNLQSAVTSPWGQRNPEPYFDRQTRIYAYALDPAARWPFQPRDELQPPAPAPVPAPATSPAPKDAPKDAASDASRDTAKDTPKDAPKEAAKDATKEPPKPPSPQLLVLEGIRERLYEVPVAAGNYAQLTTDGKRLFFLVNDPSERKTHLRSVAIEAPNPTPPVVDSFMDDIRSYRMTQDRKKLMVRKVNDVWVFDAGKAAPPPPEMVKFAVNARDWSIALDPRREWQQMFVDAWRMHRDFFYDPGMQGADWATARARYQPLLDRATDRAEVNDVIAQMISEVRALHSQTNPGDIRRGQDTIDVAGLAADFSKTAAGFRVDKIFGGDPELIEEKSPLARAEVNIRVGDVITTVNGVAATSAASMGQLLLNQTDKQMLVSVLGANARTRDVIVTPVSTQRERELRYLTWERERNDAVERASQGRIGYVHLQAMGPNDIARWAREFYPVYQRDGLIIDLRHNRGGSIDSWIIEKLQRRAWHFWQSRRTDENFHNQQLAFRGHVIALIDAETYSDGETMAQGLRRLGIAPLVGMTTAGAGIWLSDQNRLRDNGIARAAEFGSFVDTAKERAWITEFVGVAPDVAVDNLPFATFKGQDAQLERAIAMLMEKMAKEPVAAPVMPAFPDRAK